MKNNERLARLKLILKDEGLEKLAGSTVMVLGLGGVGSSAAEALARGGVGTLIVLDRDVVEASNCNRQALAFTRTIGQKKSDVMAAMIHEINPEITVHAQEVFLTVENIAQTLESFPRPDYVLDCIDTVSQKLEVARWCAQHGVRLIASMGAANKLDPSYLRLANIRRTENCGLSKVIRLECRKRGIRSLEVLYSYEEPVKPAPLGGHTKGETLGSMSYMPPIMGQILAGAVIRRLAGLEQLPGPPRLARPLQE